MTRPVEPQRRELVYQAPVPTVNIWREEQRLLPHAGRVLTRLIEELDAAGLGDPAGLRDYLKRGNARLDEARLVDRTKDDDDLAEIAQGTAAEIERRLRRLPPRDRDARRRVVVQITQVGGAIHRAGIAAVIDLGEDVLLERLKGHAAAAIAAGDDATFTAVHRLGASLREIGALSAAMSEGRDLAVMFYAFTNWPEVYLWRARAAQDSWAMTTQHAVGVTFIVPGFSRAPYPTIADFEPSWGAGYFSASEVARYCDEIGKRQEVARRTSSSRAMFA